MSISLFVFNSITEFFCDFSLFLSILLKFQLFPKISRIDRFPQKKHITSCNCVCSRCDLSSRERITINIQQPSNNWPTINLLSIYYSLSLSLYISLYLSLYVTLNHYPFNHHSQCRFIETLCVLQVGASSRRRAMALR